MNDRKLAFGSLLRWQGLMAGEDRRVRGAGIFFLALACMTMVATQLNYVVVGNAHMIVVLAPIAACALLYGPIPSTLVGGLAGLTELLHATYLPLDYYEKYFMAPWNSVGLFALVGLVMGLLYALTDHLHKQRGWKRTAVLVGIAAIGSTLFTLLFHQSAYLINVTLGVELPDELLRQFTNTHEIFSQALADFGLIAPLSLVSDAVATHNEMTRNERSIRETFQGWLAVVVAMAYMVCASCAYTGISATCRNEAEREMTGRLTYLESQLAERDKLIDGFARRSKASSRLLEEVHISSIGGVAKGISFGGDGVSVVAEDGIVVSSSEDPYLGAAFEDVVGAGLQDGFDESIYQDTVSREWDMGGGSLAYLRATEIGYVRVSKSGDYQLMVALPAGDVFRYRTPAMIAVSLSFIGIFLIVYAQASMLLQNVVVRGFDETNETLSRITDGDLTQVVDVHDSVEFTHLSGGINATVGALRKSIAEVEARFDRELSTAKAIQESALPTTFPPFPEIEKFDIFASMNAAKEVGGDFYDFFLIDDHTLGFLIADVSGKGIPASLFMMAAKTEVGNYMASGIDLSSAIQSANYHLCQGNDAGMFVTLWAATLDFDTGLLTYVNAGHNPPLLRHDGSWEWLRQRSGLFLGTFDAAVYRAHTIQLSPGDELLIYTDGVTEAFSVDEEQYGELRLERYVSAHCNDHPHALVDGVRSDVARWAQGAEQSDDITLLSLEYGVAPEVTGSLSVPATVDQLDKVMGFIHGELGRRLCPISVQNQIDIALEELFVNICSYAYADSEEGGTVGIDYIYNASPNAMTIQLTDHGVEFDPLGSDDPERIVSIDDAKIGGLGIFMTKRMVDDLSYMRDGDANVVAFRKVW